MNQLKTRKLFYTSLFRFYYYVYNHLQKACLSVWWNPGKIRVIYLFIYFLPLSGKDSHGDVSFFFSHEGFC